MTIDRPNPLGKHMMVVMPDGGWQHGIIVPGETKPVRYDLLIIGGLEFAKRVGFGRRVD